MPLRDSLNATFDEAAQSFERFRADPVALAAVETFADHCLRVVVGGGTLYACGNGGSMAQAMHFTEEWTGRFRNPRQAIPAISFSDPTQLTCIANDFGFEEVFARQIEACVETRDLLLLLSTSGESPNMIRAAEAGRAKSVPTVALLGRGGGKLASKVDLPIIVPEAETSDRIQEVHLHVLHAVIEAVEREVFPGDY